MGETLTKLFGASTSAGGGGGGRMLIARVTKVVYGPYLSDGKTIDPDYEDITSIGSIRYIILNSDQYNSGMASGNRPARPAFSSIQQFPSEHEYVLLIPGPGLGFNERAGDTDLYYLPPFNLWASCHHNAAPNLGEYADYFNIEQADYNTIDRGISNGPNTTSPAYPLGNDFVEMGHIQNLKPFVGDLLLQSRWGQSIRFGSSLATNSKINPWSKSNNDGDPIIIIRNGQSGDTGSIGYNLTIEDINQDKSSIYLTAGQQIDIIDIRANFPLTSWGVSLGVDIAAQAAVETVVATMTVPPAANTTLSPDEQDKAVLKDEPRPPSADDIVNAPAFNPNESTQQYYSEEYLQKWDAIYQQYYKNFNWQKNTDDGFDSFYHYYGDKFPKVTKNVPKAILIVGPSATQETIEYYKTKNISKDTVKPIDNEPLKQAILASPPAEIGNQPVSAILSSLVKQTSKRKELYDKGELILVEYTESVPHVDSDKLNTWRSFVGILRGRNKAFINVYLARFGTLERDLPFPLGSNIEQQSGDNIPSPIGRTPM